MHIRPLDLASDEEILAAWDVKLEERRRREPGFAPTTRAAMLSLIRDGIAGGVTQQVVAVADPGDPLTPGAFLATGLVSHATASPADPHTVDVQVHPDARRHGIGSAMLAHLEAMTDAPVLVGSGTVRDDDARRRLLGFAAPHGWAADTEEVIRTLTWPADLPPMPETGPYTVRAWVGDIPPEHELGYARLAVRVMAESPTGSVSYTAQEPSPDLYQERRRMDARRGYQRVTALAIGPDGEVAGFSDVGFFPEEATPAGTGTTIVAREHRGHRLGLALKVASLRALASTGAPATEVSTSNDAANRWMIAVNEAVGFREDYRILELVKRR